MERVTPKLLVGWLVGAIALAFGVVGCGSITHHDRSPFSTLSGSGDGLGPGRILGGQLKPCTLTNGDAGLQFDDLCLPAPPAGWTGTRVRIRVQPTSFLTLPRDCESVNAENAPLSV